MSEWTTNDWIVALGVAIILHVLARVALTELAAKRRRRERRAEWEADRPLREAMARQSKERRKAEEKRALAFIESMRIKPEDSTTTTGPFGLRVHVDPNMPPDVVALVGRTDEGKPSVVLITDIATGEPK